MASSTWHPIYLSFEVTCIDANLEKKGIEGLLVDDLPIIAKTIRYSPFAGEASGFDISRGSVRCVFTVDDRPSRIEKVHLPLVLD